MSEKIGYTCSCGHFNPADAWASAHWFEVLLHTCKGCGVENQIKDGDIYDGSEDEED